MPQTLRELLTTDVTDALHREDPFEQTLHERATAIVEKILPTLHNHFRADLAAADEHFGTHVDLLAEWYQWWARDETQPGKLPDALHVRTASALAAVGQPILVRGPSRSREDAKPQVSEPDDEPV